MTNRELTIVIKGSHYPQIGFDNSTSLGRLIARGKQTENTLHAGTDSLLFELFGLEIEQGKDIPAAAVTRLLDLGVVDKGWWLRADPVHLAPGRTGLLMVANRELELTSAESEALAREITDAVLEEGWILKAPNPHRWYLKPAHTPEITTTPLDVLMGRDIDAYLPAGKDAKNWHTRLNEIQILLHTSQINVEREADDKLPVNSVWFWGGGTLPQLNSTSWTSLWSDDVLSLALARLSDTNSQKIPSPLKEWPELASAGNHLMVIDQDQLLRDMQESEQNLAEVLRKALEQNELDRLTVYSGSEKMSVITPANVKPRWKWRFPFSRR